MAKSGENVEKAVEKKTADVSAELENVKAIMEQLMSDTSVPRNIRGAVQDARDKLSEATDDLTVNITSAAYILDDVSNDINMPQHARTEIWTIISNLESIREKIK